MSTNADDERDDIDTRFAEIVSRWDDPPSEAHPSPTGRGGAPFFDAAPPPDAPEPPLVPESAVEPEDDEEGFDPPPVSPLPSPASDWPFYLALGGLVLGPLWLIWLVVASPTERSLMWLAGGLTVVGFITVVARQPRDRDPDEGDGAQV